MLLYGLSMAAVLLLLKLLETHLLVLNYRLELFIAAIAIVFTVLGIWLSLNLVKPKTVVVEKEVILAQAGPSEVNQHLIDQLGISKRELEVLQLMAAGLSNEEIANRLFVSLNTVKTHSSNLFVKLEVKRRTQAAEKAKRLRIIV